MFLFDFRGKRGKSVTASVFAETSQYDSHEKQMSKKSRIFEERLEPQKSPVTSSPL
jgi:hypothetical protein